VLKNKKSAVAVNIRPYLIDYISFKQILIFLSNNI